MSTSVPIQISKDTEGPLINGLSKFQIDNLFEMDQLQKIHIAFCKSSQAPVSLIYKNGLPIISAKNSCKIVKNKICVTWLNEKLNHIESGQYLIVKCKAGFFIGITPIMVNGHHAGTLMVGPTMYSFLELDPSSFKTDRTQQCPSSLLLERITVIERARFEQITESLAIFGEQLSNFLNSKAQLYNAIRTQYENRQTIGENEQQYKKLFENARDPICLIDEDAMVIKCNNKALELFRCKNNQIIGKSALDYVPMSREQLLVDRLQHEWLYQRPDGTEFVAEASITRFDVQSKRIYQVIFRDITEKKEKERSKKLQSLGTLAGSVAHDFNNLLMAIMANNHLIEKSVPPDHQLMERTQAIKECIGIGSKITEQILHFARAGKVRIRIFNLNEVVETMIKKLFQSENGIALQLNFVAKKAMVEGDQDQIAHAFMNVVMNGCQSMPNGGTLTITTEKMFLKANQIGTFPKSSGIFVKAKVTDTGVGMSKETLERVFEPFFTTREIGTGYGLGLSSAYGIIDNHGGLLNVTSKVGKGTTIIIYLPHIEKG